MFRLSNGAKLFLAGVAVAAGGLGWLAAMHQFPAPLPRLLVNHNAAPVGIGLLLMALGCVLYTAEPAVNAKAAGNPATIQTSLAMFVTALVLTTALSLPLVLIPGQAAAGRPANAALQPWILTYLIVTSELPILFVVWLRLVKPGCLSWRGLGLTGGNALAGVAGGLLLFVTAAAVSAALNALGVHQNQFERFAGVEHAPIPAFLAAFIAGAVLAPLCEEVFFRGYVFQTFGKHYGLPLAYIYSAGLFAIVHTDFAAAVPIFVLGLLLAFYFKKSGSLVPSIVAHGLNNGIAFCLLYAGFTG